MTTAMMTMRRITTVIIPLQIREFIEAKFSYSVTLNSFDVSDGRVMFSTSADKAMRKDVSTVAEILHRITSKTWERLFLALRR
jgi:NADPH-dependent 7-cyano-7-deazaguanine reductase QueF-like protein